VATQQKSLHATERDTAPVQQARAAYRQLMATLDVHRLKFVDDAGVNLAMTRLYGRAPRGTRVLGQVPQHYGPHVTMLGTLGVQGLQAVMTGEGATDADVFRTYVKRVLGPTLPPGDTVGMDHLRAHKAVGVQQALARRGARLLYVPPDSPDLSPIEPCWSTVKTALRKAKARTRDALDTTITRALPMVTGTDGQEIACGEVRVRDPDLLQAKGLLEEGSDLLRVLGRNRDMPGFGAHGALPYGKHRAGASWSSRWTDPQKRGREQPDLSPRTTALCMVATVLGGKVSGCEVLQSNTRMQRLRWMSRGLTGGIHRVDPLGRSTHAR
jgi:transposase